MSESTLRELVYGKGAHIDPVACIEDISAEMAATTVPESPYSIWQIVLHMNYWMDHEFRKIAGENPQIPEHAIESWPQHPDPSNPQWKTARDSWAADRQHFVDSLAKLAELTQSDFTTLDRVVPEIAPDKSSRQSTVRATLWQIAAHNSYHSGQIALLRRQAGAWPPERGGDTW